VVVWADVPENVDARILTEKFHTAHETARRAYLRWVEQGGSGTPASAGTEPVPETPVSVASFTPETFQDAVRAAQDYIAAGHTYQVNLSLRQSQAAPADPAAIYESLRRVNPSPYMGFLRLPGMALVCGSPELLVKLVDGRIVSRPIAGTRPRGANAEDDRNLATELVANEKERAEHLMLVDLIRNDIGCAAGYGSVLVREFMGIERYSHVMHLVSEIEGRLAPGKTWAELLRSMFPGGTITGCPKIRTMEIIEELEPVGRGFYTGSLGWISYGGELEMNIIIRSMLVQAGIAHVQAGAGIVADSQPEREFDEATRKAQALWVALERTQVQHHG
jgi:para-aminobenzoate synthetase component 1